MSARLPAGIPWAAVLGTKRHPHKVLALLAHPPPAHSRAEMTLPRCPTHHMPLARPPRPPISCRLLMPAMPRVLGASWSAVCTASRSAHASAEVRGRAALCGCCHPAPCSLPLCHCRVSSRLCAHLFHPSNAGLPTPALKALGRRTATLMHARTHKFSDQPKQQPTNRQQQLTQEHPFATSFCPGLTVYLYTSLKQSPAFVCVLPNPPRSLLSTLCLTHLSLPLPGNPARFRSPPLFTLVETPPPFSLQTSPV